MDYQRALARMAELGAAREKFLEEHIEPLAREAEKAGKAQWEIPPDLRQQLAQHNSEIQTFGAQLNAIPEFQDVMPHWNVTITGLQSIEPDFIDALGKAPDRGRAMDEAFQRLGGMPNAISRCMAQVGFTQHSREVMRNGWRIGMRCTEGASRRICAILHRRFRSAIESGSISVERHFADHSLARDPMAPRRPS